MIAVGAAHLGGDDDHRAHVFLTVSLDQQQIVTDDLRSTVQLALQATELGPGVGVGVQRVHPHLTGGSHRARGRDQVRLVDDPSAQEPERPGTARAAVGVGGVGAGEDLPHGRAGARSP